MKIFALPAHFDFECGAIGLPVGNCIFAKYDNIKYVSNPDAEGRSVESNEMVISMRNDCSDNSCCDDSTICTSYTSGMMTSKQSYGYGSFQFLLKIESETKGTNSKNINLLF